MACLRALHMFYAHVIWLVRVSGSYNTFHCAEIIVDIDLNDMDFDPSS